MALPLQRLVPIVEIIGTNDANDCAELQRARFSTFTLRRGLARREEENGVESCKRQ